MHETKVLRLMIMVIGNFLLLNITMTFKHSSHTTITDGYFKVVEIW